MKVKCPHCFKQFDWELTESEKKLAFQMIIQNKEFMRELGRMAAEQYIKDKNI